MFTESTYVRADAGVQIFGKKFKGKQDGPYFDAKKPDESMILSFGGGYKFTDNLRTDLSFAYSEAKVESFPINHKVKSYTLFLNGYYDFKVSDTFTPYVTAGVGLARNKSGDLRYAVPGPQSDISYKGKTKNNFAWNAGLGVQMNVAKNLDVDLGYKYLDLGKTQFEDGHKPHLVFPGDKIKMKSHRITLGVVCNF